MSEIRLSIKGMVCPRCIESVRSVFIRNNIEVQDIGLGYVVTQSHIDNALYRTLSEKLKKNGFELLVTNEAQLVNRVKSLIIEIIHYSEEPSPKVLSEYIAEKLSLEYSTISKLFSAVESITIEKYYIDQRIEKVKELITYDQLTFREIADKLNFSNASHLSNQFKKVTGLSPREFKELGNNERRFINDI